MLINIYISITTSLKKGYLQNAADEQKSECVSNLTFPLVAASFALLTPPNQCARSDEHFPHRRTRTKGLLTEKEEGDHCESSKQSATLPEITFNENPKKSCSAGVIV